eukprot:225086-Heterocapsa_arctica.AAC.1
MSPLPRWHRLARLASARHVGRKPHRRNVDEAARVDQDLDLLCRHPEVRDQLRTHAEDLLIVQVADADLHEVV